MKTKPLTFILALTFLFLFSGSVYGEEPEVKREHYDSGKLKSELHLKNGKLEGLSTLWYESGAKKAETHFKNGKREGLETDWYESGKKRLEAHFKNGKEDGLRTGWDESGKKKLEIPYKNGKEEGLGLAWYESDAKKSEYHYKNGKQEGLTTLWYESGKKKLEGHFKNGIENGIRKEWDESGKLVFEENFVGGSVYGEEPEVKNVAYTKWFIIGAILLYIYNKVVVKEVKLKFWKLAQVHSDKAYQLFISSPAWHVCEANSNETIDTKKWMGPSWIRTPDGRKVKVYGKYGEFEKTQDEFIKIYGRK
jgi:antitoxin component YwqK of YwqJK toxin-antitoxin module